MVVSCGEVRRYLSGLRTGSPPSASPELFQLLVERGAVTGEPGNAQLTAVGSHVLHELEVRASRVDAMTLDDFATQLARVMTDLDSVARTAEYFLAELGPVAPPEALPRLRPTAVGLANRRETPEDLAREFRNIWGAVEVMGGDSRDRLVAAELLHSARAPMDQIYSPMMTTSITVREIAGAQAPAVTVAALLHLHPLASGRPALAEYQSLRKATASEEGAAMLASTGRDPASLMAARSQWLAALGAGSAPPADLQAAAGYLTVLGADPSTALTRVQSLTAGLQPRLPASAELMAALLSNVRWLEPGELLDWVAKATEIARARKLAPTPGELAVLAVSLVMGLPSTEFLSTDAASEPSRLVAVASLLALNSWAYARLTPAASPTPPAAR